MLVSSKISFLKTELFLSCYFIVLCLHPMCFADLYYWIDAKGVKHYSNSQPEMNTISQLPEIYSDSTASEHPKEKEIGQSIVSQIEKTTYGPKVNIKYEYYDVIGVNINDLNSETIKLSPIRQNGIIFRGNTQWHIMPHYKVKQQNDIWYFDYVSATVDITFTMPRWIDYRKANRDEQKRWDIFYKALMDHEYGHKDIAIEAAEKICKTLIELGTRAGKAELNKIWAIRAEQIYKECKILNKQFDEETDHGAKTGAIMR